MHTDIHNDKYIITSQHYENDWNVFNDSDVYLLFNAQIKRNKDVIINVFLVLYYFWNIHSYKDKCEELYSTFPRNVILYLRVWYKMCCLVPVRTCCTSMQVLTIAYYLHRFLSYVRWIGSSSLFLTSSRCETAHTLIYTAIVNFVKSILFSYETVFMRCYTIPIYLFIDIHLQVMYQAFLSLWLWSLLWFCSFYCPWHTCSHRHAHNTDNATCRQPSSSLLLLIHLLLIHLIHLMWLLRLLQRLLLSRLLPLLLRLLLIRPTSTTATTTSTTTRYSWHFRCCNQTLKREKR